MEDFIPNFRLGLITKYPITQVNDTFYLYKTVIIYHTSRGVFRVYKDNIKTKWNKVLQYCIKNEEYTEDRYLHRYLDEYEMYDKYEVFCTNDDISNLRTIEDLKNKYAEFFI